MARDQTLHETYKVFYIPLHNISCVGALKQMKPIRILHNASILSPQV